MNRRPLTVRLVASALALAIATAPISNLRAAQVIAPTGMPLSVDVSKGLIVRLDRPCSSVFVADPDIADVQLKSPTMLYVMGKSAGETTIYAVDGNDAVLLNSRVEVHQDIDRLQREILQLDPGSKVRIKSVDDSIVLEGNIKDAAEGDDIRKIAARYVATPAQLVNKLKIDAPNQVNLQVRIAEVQRTVLKQFGINWENIQQSTVASFGFVNAVPALAPAATAGGAAATKILPPLAGSSLGNVNPATSAGFNTPTSTLIGQATNNNIFASFRNGNFLISALIDALAQNGLITILAEPNLVTVSGQKASFLAGGEFPVPVPETGSSGSGTAAIAIDWKKFGVSLDFTPTILADGRIGLHVAPEVSELAPTQGITIQGVTVPGITTRRADTTVELGSGQTFAIAGLLQNQTQQQLNSYPWIGDIPIIGTLFRSTAFQRGETELVILVTPYLVKPVSSATALKTDNDGFYAPTDAERLSSGKLNTTPAPTTPGQNPAQAPTMPTSMPAGIPTASPITGSAVGNAAVAAAPPPTLPKAFTAPSARSAAAAPGFEID